MKRFLSILVVLTCSICHAQNYVDNVIGRYLCTRLVLDNNGNPSQPSCTCYFELTPNNVFPNTCVLYRDSCFGGGWDHVSQDVEVMPDSSFQGYEPWADSSIATGKLYPNDSIYYRIFYPVPPTYNRWKEFRGFKLYSFVAIKELGKPENELLISPQPASDLLYIQSTQVLFTEKKLPVLYDLNRKKIVVPFYYVNANTFKADVTELNPGMYVLAIETEKGILRKKIVVGK